MTKEEVEAKKREEEDAAKKKASAKSEVEREQVLVYVDDIKKITDEAAESGARKALEAAGVGKVDRSRVAVQLEGEGEGEGEDGDGEGTRSYGSAGRTTPAFEVLYRGLPDWERKIRTPDVDHHIADWAIGVMRNDYARMSRAHDAIYKITGVRDLNISDDSALVPSPLASIIVEKRRKVQVIGPRAQHFTSESSTLKVPTESTFAAAAGVLEGGAITPTDPVHASVTLSKVKSIVATRSSVEFFDDNAFNAVSFLSRQAARTIALRNDAQDSVDGDGTGTNQGDAIENNGAIGTVDSNVGVLVFTDVTALWYGLNAEWRVGAVWMGNSAMMGILGETLDGNGRPIFAPGEAPATPLSGGHGAPGVGVIFGRPVLELSAMTAGTLILGDLEFFGVLEDAAIRAEFSKDEAFLTDELTWKWVQRRDGRVLQAEAFKKSLQAT